jgi:hypothetical protein
MWFRYTDSGYGILGVQILLNEYNKYNKYHGNYIKVQNDSAEARKDNMQANNIFETRFLSLRVSMLTV